MMDSEIQALSADLLAQRCAERPPHTRQPAPTAADRYCLELLRRAFGGTDEYALGLVLDLYQRVWSRQWIRDAAAFDHQAQTADDFRNIAFFNVYETLKGTDLSGFTSLTPFLSYLYKSVIRTVAASFRSKRSRQAQVRPDDTQDTQYWEQIAADQDVHGEVEKKLLWQSIEQQIATILTDEKDRFLFECRAKQDLSRAEIVREFTARWPDLTFDSESARAALQRIHRHLVKDKKLRALVKQYIGRPDLPEPEKD
jgi:DNA-directed RNA polymerase specialized sigma24 family protein